MPKAQISFEIITIQQIYLFLFSHRAKVQIPPISSHPVDMKLEQGKPCQITNRTKETRNRTLKQGEKTKQQVTKSSKIKLLRTLQLCQLLIRSRSRPSRKKLPPSSQSKPLPPALVNERKLSGVIPPPSHIHQTQEQQRNDPGSPAVPTLSFMLHFSKCRRKSSSRRCQLLLRGVVFRCVDLGPQYQSGDSVGYCGRQRAE